jgi:hypothetical protein
VVPLEVTLTERERDLCHYVARVRDAAGQAAGADAAKFGNDKPTLARHVEGCLGECAAAKALNFYWTGMGTSYRDDADVSFVQVRWTSHADGRLLIRPPEAERLTIDLPWVLVIDLGDLRYTLPGWLVGREAVQERWRANPRGRGECWMVPQWALRDFADADWLLPRVCVLPEDV